MANGGAPVRFEAVHDATGVAAVCSLAEVIWREHYTPIIGEAQVQYMLEHVHSAQVIQRELGQGSLYYLMLKDDEPVGYLCVKPEVSTLFLSKVYVLASQRGSGIGRQALARIREIAAERNLHLVRLTVNRHNRSAIAAYRRWGFEVVGETCADIGGGYVMDDYAMELRLDPQA